MTEGFAFSTKGKTLKISQMDFRKTQCNCVLIKVLLDFFQKIAGCGTESHGFNQSDKFKFIVVKVNLKAVPEREGLRAVIFIYFCRRFFPAALFSI